MTPVDRFVPRFVAEPPQDALPHGRWAERLRHEFLGACLSVDPEGEDLGEPGDIMWYPDRTWHGRTYVPATAPTSRGYELFGYVRFLPATPEREAGEFSAAADFTDETADKHPEWSLDLCDEVIGSWRGESGEGAAMTLIWGRPLRPGGALVTAELDDLAVDQCALIEERFTLIAPDDYRGDLLDIRLFGAKAQELARESLYDAEEPAGED